MRLLVVAAFCFISAGFVFYSVTSGFPTNHKKDLKGIFQNGFQRIFLYSLCMLCSFGISSNTSFAYAEEV